MFAFTLNAAHREVKTGNSGVMPFQCPVHAQRQWTAGSPHITTIAPETSPGAYIGPNSSQVHTRSLLHSTRHMGSQRLYIISLWTHMPPEPPWTNQSMLMSASTSTQCEGCASTTFCVSAGWGIGRGNDGWSEETVCENLRGHKPSISHMIVFL